MLIEVTQKLPEEKTQKTLLNSANIVRIIPWQGGSLVKDTSGGDTETVENPAWFKTYWKD
jgi:hypothetical protein